MLLGSFFFAGMATSAHELRSSCDWQVIAVVRSTLPLTFAVLFALLGGVRLVLFSPGILWVRSIAGSISLICTFYAFTHLPPAHVFTLTSTFPIWVALLSWPLYNERPGLQVWVSVLGSVLGVALMELSGSAVEMETDVWQHGTAVASTLVASFSTAVAMLGLHRLSHVHPWAIVAHFSGVALLFSIVSLFAGGHSPAPASVPPAGSLLLLLLVGATATVGQLFLTKAFTAGPPAKVAVVNLTQIVFAMILDVCVGDHGFRPLMLAGMALVVAPTAWMMASRGRG
jgi:drug/metabolite transporter (DMT)-like permease